MIRIITARTLAALREDAGQLPALRELAGESVRQAGESRAEAERTAAELEALCDEAAGTLAGLVAAAQNPATGSRVQEGIALHVLRAQIRKVKASGDPEAIAGIGILDAVLGQDSAFASRSIPEPEAARGWSR